MSNLIYLLFIGLGMGTNIHVQLPRSVGPPSGDTMMVSEAGDQLVTEAGDNIIAQH